MKYIFKIIILLLFLSCTKNQSKSALNQINEVPLDTINAETLINDIYRSKGYNSISKIDNLKRNVSITINYIEGDSALNSLPELYSIQKNLFDSKSIVRTIIQVKGKKYIYYDQIHGGSFDIVHVCPYKNDTIDDCIEIKSIPKSMTDSLRYKKRFYSILR